MTVAGGASPRGRRLLLAAAMLIVATFMSRGPAMADDEAIAGPDVAPAEPEMSREDWRQRVEQARRRAREVARERRDHPELYAPVPEDPDLVATERLLNDQSLQAGDIVSTRQGLFVYRGRGELPRRREDFVPVPSR